MDISDIKAGNVREILECIRDEDGLTKREISLRTNLSFSTVSTVCNALRNREILYEEKENTGMAGRIPSKLYVHFDRFLTVCLDLQLRDTMGFAILNYRNEILFHAQYNISHVHGIREIAGYAHEIFLQKRAEPALQHAKFLGVGVSVSGIFDKTTQTIRTSAISYMEGAPVKAVVEDVFGIPCYVDNESNLCAVAVHQQNAHVYDLLYMHISQGVGIGIITGGTLLSGHNGYAAEIAHFPFGTTHRRCPICGNYGCVEPELSVSGMLRNGVWQETSASDAEQWAQMSAKITSGDPAYLGFLKETGELMGKVLSVLIDLFDPQYVFVGGEITDIFEQVCPYAEKVIRKHCFMVRDRVLPLLCDKNSSVNMVLGLNYIMCQKWDPLAGNLY